MLRIIKNWIFQGLFTLDISERYFKISLEIILFIVFFYFFSGYLLIKYSLILSFVICHTIVWFFNGSPYMLFLDEKIVTPRKNEIQIKLKYIERLKEKVNSKNSISTCVLFGSISRGEMHERSDIDIRMIRTQGFKNSIKAFLFGMRERSYCAIHKIPLGGGYIGDSILFFEKMRDDEPPIILKDIKNIIKNNYTTYYHAKDIIRLNKLEETI